MEGEGGGPIFLSRVNRSVLLTRSNALMKSIKDTYSGFYPLHFSCSCCTENIISSVGFFAVKPHCHFRYTIHDLQVSVAIDC